MNELVSIIVPVYNASQFLHKTLNSIKRQTYKNIEVLCVDDGSTDNSVDIINEFCKLDKRFRLIQQKNQHAGIARNNGFKNANGEYVVFLDSDDFFKRNMIKKLVETMNTYDSDIVEFGYYAYNNQNHLKRKISVKYPNKLINVEDIKDDIFQIDVGSPWHKFYKKSFLDETKIEYQDLLNTNDIFYTYMNEALAKTIYFLDENFVFYRTFNKASLQGGSGKKTECLYIAFKSIFEELQKRDLINLYETSLKKAYIFNFTYHIEKNDSFELRKELFNYCYDLFSLVKIKKDDLKNLNINHQRLVESIIENDLSQYMHYANKCKEEDEGLYAKYLDFKNEILKKLCKK